MSKRPVLSAISVNTLPSIEPEVLSPLIDDPEIQRFCLQVPPPHTNATNRQGSRISSWLSKTANGTTSLWDEYFWANNLDTQSEQGDQWPEEEDDSSDDELDFGCKGLTQWEVEAMYFPPLEPSYRRTHSVPLAKTYPSFVTANTDPYTLNCLEGKGMLHSRSYKIPDNNKCRKYVDVPTYESLCSGTTTPESDREHQGRVTEGHCQRFSIKRKHGSRTPPSDDEDRTSIRNAAQAKRWTYDSTSTLYDWQKSLAELVTSGYGGQDSNRRHGIVC